MELGDGGDKHDIGNPKCEEGRCGDEYPKPCECGGLVHASFGDENSDGDWWIYTRCDRCGEPE